MDYLKPYADFLRKKFSLRVPMRAVFDCSNGTTGLILKELIRELRITNNELWRNSKFIILNSTPDGNFPAHGPNPMVKGALNDLKKAVLRNGADFGAIFDADGDRVFFIDDRGREVPADAVLGLISQAFPGPIVTDIRSGYLAKELIVAGRKKIIESRVGHTFFKRLMRRRKCGFGGEISGHYYSPLADGTFFDSGIAAAVYFANEVSELKMLGGKLSEWLDSLPRYFRSGEINFQVDDKEEVMVKVERQFKRSAGKISKLDGLKMEFGNAARSEALAEEWWFSLRPSQTENFLRLNLEAKDEKMFRRRLAELKRLI